jgi:hypothetical protein
MAILHVRGVPDDLYAHIREKAQAERRSISGEVILLLERALAAHEEERDAGWAEFQRRKEALQREAAQLYVPRLSSTEERADRWSQIEAFREALAEKYGTLPDSTPILRADRDRDG